jgi:small subunit ribosomal protein S2
MKKEALAVREARRLGITVIGLVDTNCDPDDADFIIPGNDDAIRSTGLIVRVLADAVAEGQLKVRAAEMEAEAARRAAEEAAAAEAEAAAAAAAEAEAAASATESQPAAEEAPVAVAAEQETTSSEDAS